MFKLEFREITLQDKPKIKENLSKSDFQGCEYSFANNFAWRRLYDSRIAFYKGFYIICNNEPAFTFPAGLGSLEDYKEVFGLMRNHADSLDSPLKINGITEKTLKIIENVFSDKFTISSTPDWFDYIYLKEDLIELEGKKFHQKRNHLARFYENDWEYRPLTPDLFDECTAFSAVTYTLKKGFTERSSIVEQFVIHTFFEHFSELELQGGVLFVDGHIAAFTIAEKLNSNTVCIHIEKADVCVHGAFAAINREFLAHLNDDAVIYVNREEDMGIEGLRKAKRSYNPIYQIEKMSLVSCLRKN